MVEMSVCGCRVVFGKTGPSENTFWPRIPGIPLNLKAYSCLFVLAGCII